MIQANELRIGNILDYEYGEPNERQFGFFSEIEDGEDIVDIEKGVVKIQPIHLTPEILEKCGFVQQPDLLWSIKYFHIGLYSDGYGYFDGTHKVGIGVKYLHQLQNLYFALTGEELTVKL